MSRKQRVTWTDEEEERLIEAVAHARRADPEPTLFQLVKSTQELIFKPDRRRALISIIPIRELYNRIVVRCTESPPELVIEEPVPEPDLEDRLEKLESYFVEISDQLHTQASSFTNKLDSLRSRIDELEKNSKEKRIRLGLAGLLKSQFNLLSSELSHLAKLYFIDVNQANISLPSSIDYLISSQMIGHRHSALFKTKYGHDNVIIIDGLIDSFRAKITELAKRV